MNDYQELLRGGGEPDPLGRIYWFRAITARSTYFLSHKEHHHPFFEWHFVLEGTMDYTVNGHALRIVRGDHLLLPPDTVHRVEGWTGDFVKLSAAFEIAPDTPLMRALTEQGVTSGRYPHPEEVTFCLAEAERDTVYSEHILRNRLLEMLCLSVDTVPAADPLTLPAPDERITAALRYLRDNPGRFWRCDEVARACGIGARQLSRLFERYEHCTLAAYLRREKVRQIQTLLEDPDIPLRTVSERTGFDNEYYFSTFFKRCNGMSPGNYRRNATR